MALSYDLEIVSSSNPTPKTRLIRVMTDSEEDRKEIVEYRTFSNVEVMIGRSFSEKSNYRFQLDTITSYPLYGLVANFFYTNSYQDVTGIKELFNELNDSVKVKYYDEFGQLIKEEYTKNAYFKKYTYNDNGYVKEETFGKRFGLGYSYDSLGNVISKLHK